MWVHMENAIIKYACVQNMEISFSSITEKCLGNGKNVCKYYLIHSDGKASTHSEHVGCEINHVRNLFIIIFVVILA